MLHLRGLRLVLTTLSNAQISVAFGSPRVANLEANFERSALSGEAKVRKGDVMQMLSTITANLNKMLPGRRTLGAALLMFISSIALVQSAVAQATQQFVGTVTDQSHAVVVGATVTIHNEDTGEDLVVKTTRAGDYTAPYLKTGYIRSRQIRPVSRP
jgi:late competence protein required for DNA uptake (superfamily II DNA/RNA helicase)